ncbi:MAG TPA: delta-60 repeat domain-containing protein, partial [Ferruginibacter sp.]|nr:delta-60 repeat domain-containing protein [Ferruginibacter sp.]
MRKTFILLPFLMAVCLLLQAQPGALDTGFPAVPQAGLSNGSFQPIVRTVLEQPDGKLLLGGNFDAYNGVARNGVLRLNADGSLDEAYHPVFEEVLPAGKLVLQTDGKLWVARQQPISATTSQCLMRLMPNGSIDGSFSCGTGFSLNNFSSGIINALLLQPDGKLVVGGMFDSYNGVNEHNIIRLNADGTIDHSFDPGSGIATSPGFGNPVVYSLALDDNGKILVGGNFQLYNGTSVTGLVRINSDGSRDNSFQTGSGPTFLNVAGSGLVESILLQPNGKILAAGRFTHFDGTNRVGVVRLESNGAVDASFASGNIIGTGADMGTAHVWSQQIQADGKIILCGFFGYGTSSGDCITRLNPDGSADPSFIPGTGLDAFGLNEQIYSSCLLSTGKLMIAGNFTSYNQQSVNRVARISTTCELSV